MNDKWTKLQNAIDEFYNLTDKIRSSIACTKHTYDADRAEYTITLEYTVKLPHRSRQIHYDIVDNANDRPARSPREDSILQSILSDVQAIRANVTTDRSKGKR